MNALLNSAPPHILVPPPKGMKFFAVTAGPKSCRVCLREDKTEWKFLIPIKWRCSGSSRRLPSISMGWRRAGPRMFQGSAEELMERPRLPTLSELYILEPVFSPDNEHFEQKIVPIVVLHDVSQIFRTMESVTVHMDISDRPPQDSRCNTSHPQRFVHDLQHRPIRNGIPRWMGWNIWWIVDNIHLHCEVHWFVLLPSHPAFCFSIPKYFLLLLLSKGGKTRNSKRCPYDLYHYWSVKSNTRNQTSSSFMAIGCLARRMMARVRVDDMVSKLAKRIPNITYMTKSSDRKLSVSIPLRMWSMTSPLCFSGLARLSLMRSFISFRPFFWVWKQIDSGYHNAVDYSRK